MSDRICTIDHLRSFVEQRGCSLEVAQHQAGHSFLAEHGPFAGIGYFQDLAAVSLARSSFIGMTRTSSDLLKELVEFNRMMELWRQGRDLSSVKPIDHCVLDKEFGPDALAKMEAESSNVAAQASQKLTEEEACSCLSSSAADDCCQRVLRRSHKQGYILTRDIFKSYDGINVTQEFRTELPSIDYRDVIVTRDWYETLISGYLYHKMVSALLWRKLLVSTQYRVVSHAVFLIYLGQ
jgi:hypothetical protein